MNGNMKRKGPWFGSAVLAGMGILLAATLLGAFLILFLQYWLNGGGSISSPIHTYISITSPGPGSEMPAQAYPIAVQVYAHGDDAFDSMQLWINGEAAGQHVAPEGGLNPWYGEFHWRPVNSGNYTLIAGVFDDRHPAALSDAIPVTILSSPNLASDANNAEGIVLPSYEVMTPPLLPASPPSVPEPAQPWTGSPGDWVQSLLADELPAAPVLALNVQGCNVMLSFLDTSDNEEGFLIHRQSNDGPWVGVSKLQSQSEQDWLSYIDTDLTGTATYYISAFNSQGTALSNLVSAEFSTEGCPPTDPVVPPGWYIQLVDLQTDSDVDRAYCYRSYGDNWARWPQFGFFEMGESGLQVEGALERFATPGMKDALEIAPRQLILECWGWKGGQLLKLGTIAADNLLSDASLLQSFSSQGLSATLHAGVNWINYDQSADWSDSTMPSITAAATFEGGVSR
jgi:hypothetical protein